MARPALKPWLRYLRAGDLLTLALAAAGCAASFALLWRGEIPDRAIVRAGGRIVAELPLDRRAELTVDGQPFGQVAEALVSVGQA